MLSHAQSVSLTGRYVVDIRNNHLIVDAGPNRGGTAEAPTPGEYFLAGIASCAVVVMNGEAKRLDLRIDAIEADAEIVRDEADQHGIAAINLSVVTHGASRADAEKLLQIYLDECPVYAAVSRGTPVNVKLDVAP